MATIRTIPGIRGNTYNVQIRIRPYGNVTKTFKKKKEAERWAAKTEMEMREGKYGLSSESRKKTLSIAIERYRKYVLPSVRKSRREHILNWWEKRLGHLPLKEISPALIAEIRDSLTDEEVNGKKKSAATVVKYLVVLSHILNTCVNEWQWLENNPVMKVSKPSLPRGRTRFLDDDERERLLQACQESKNPYLYTIVVLSISTGMRRSEMLNLTWRDVDCEKGSIILKETKNGEVRVLPLESLALQLVKKLKERRPDSILLFPGTDPHKPIDFRSAWRAAINKAGLKNFKYHDCRHTFASYCIMNGSSLNEIAALLGHKNCQTVTPRYCHFSNAHHRNTVLSMNEKIFGKDKA
jgi:integrase